VRQTYAHMGEIGIDDPVLAALTRLLPTDGGVGVG
jgi:hypothetical protein